MKNYTTTSILTFGKFKGKSISEVLLIEPSYVSWCIEHLNHFLVDFSELEEFKKVNHTFGLKPEQLEILEYKIESYEDELNNQFKYNDFDDCEKVSDEDVFDALTDGMFGDFEDWGGDIGAVMDALGL